jgi:rod shape determining protein RodA
MSERTFFGFDFVLLFSTIALMVVGILFIYSSGVSSTGVIVSNEYIKQIIWVVSGIVILFVVAFIDYLRFKDFALYLYVGLLLLLVATLFLGRVVNGSRSWLGFFGFGGQPSEPMKIATILMLAKFYESRQKEIKKLSILLLSLVFIGIPMLLILAQPDLGTALVFIPIFLAMSFVAGAKKEYILFIALTGTILIVFTILPFYEKFIAKKEIFALKVFTDLSLLKYLLLSLVLVLAISLIGFLKFKKRYFYWIIYLCLILLLGLGTSVIARSVLKEYQVMRLIVFMDPSVDPKGTGWNIIQSVTAVGSGGTWGKGFLKGTQSHYRFLPQQSTDFIFSIIAEEWGFAGSFLIITLFLVITIRGLFVLFHAKDRFAVYTGAGIIAMFFFHVVVNIGMAIGIMPITGIPLFFLSYGGSSLWTGVVGVGLLISIYYHRYKY